MMSSMRAFAPSMRIGVEDCCADWIKGTWSITYGVTLSGTPAERGTVSEMLDAKSWVKHIVS
jgi:hypothetical protein